MLVRRAAARLGPALVVAALFAGARCGSPPAVGAAGPRPVIVVGLDAADWSLLDGYMADGTMPVLASLARESVTATLRGSEPLLSPIAWTTMLTGVSPLEHRILDFFRLNPVTGAPEPITSDERAVPAIWNMATQARRRVAVIGVWATWPAEQVDGTIVSERLVLGRSGEPLPGRVHPASWETRAASALAEADRALDLDAMREYLPWLTADYRGAVRPGERTELVAGLRQALLQTRVHKRLALEALREQKPELTIVYVHGTDAVSHLFARFSPPRLANVTAEDYERYSGVARRYFAEIDAMLGELRSEAAARGAILVIASDHGFRWGASRPLDVNPDSGATGAMWHRPEGVFLAWDPKRPVRGVPRGVAESRQLCATLLALAGIPPARGIAPAIAETARLARSTGEAPVDYRAQFRRAEAAGGGGASVSREAMESLRALGYVSGGGRDAGAAGPEPTRTAGSWDTEARLLQGRGDEAGAERAFRKAMELDPKSPWSAAGLSGLLARSDPAESDELLLTAVENGLPLGANHLLRRAEAAASRGDVDRARRLLDRGAALVPENAELRRRRAGL